MTIVVNYIQILYLCILKQRVSSSGMLANCCELHSNLVSLHSETTRLWFCDTGGKLWITFKSCIFAFWNNSAAINTRYITVVNYIQILYLCILKQPRSPSGVHNNSCELHSNLVSLHSETTFYARLHGFRGLWITFKSCIFAFWNNWVD